MKDKKGTTPDKHKLNENGSFLKSCRTRFWKPAMIVTSSY
jgi:hypothetical protein